TPPAGPQRNTAMLLYEDSQFASPYAMSAFVVLTEKRLSSDIETLDLCAGANHEQAYARASLTQRVPTLVDGDFTDAAPDGAQAAPRGHGFNGAAVVAQLRVQADVADAWKAQGHASTPWRLSAVLAVSMPVIARRHGWGWAETPGSCSAGQVARLPG